MENIGSIELIIMLIKAFLSKLYEIIYENPINSLLLVICYYLLYVMYKINQNKNSKNYEKLNDFSEITPLVKQDMTLKELRQYDGKINKNICLAINRKIFDVTKGFQYYGPGGRYCTLAGRDATRALADFNVFAVKDEWDDYNGIDLSQITEWENQINDQYDFVGNLVKEIPEN